MTTVTAPSLAPTLEAACKRWPDRPALIHRGRTISYGELREQARSLATAYRRLGIKPGDRVVCQLRTCPEHLIAVYAAWTCGALHVGADNDLTGEELAWLVERTEAAALVFQPRPDAPDALAPLDAVRRPWPQTTFILHQARPAEPGDHDLAELLADGSGDKRLPSEPPFGPEDPALVLLTSGTTGKPKGVLETLPGIWAKFQFFADAFSPGPDDVHLMYLPIAHVFGLKLALTALLSGGRLVMLDRFSPIEALHLIGEERVSVLPGTPTHYRLLVDALDPARDQVGSLRWGVAAAAPLPPPLLSEVYERLGIELLFVYGCTEGFLTLTTHRDDIFAGSVGKKVFQGPVGTPPNGTVRVVDPLDHHPLPVGEIGEIVFGASAPVRYWREPEVAADGWYHSGDLGHLDEQGRLHVCGRLKDLINRGGLKVAPSEVEALLARHPRVADAGVVGVPDPVLGEAVCACIVATSVDPPDLAEVRSFLCASLARHKLPDELCLVATIPRTKISKVDRPALAALVAESGVRERLRPR
ncbi:MAG: acyl--CoA ligase [Actinomycetota bacterium]|nr:acyl--CoA ligase [Actinomycetota bacterium]